MNDSSVKWGLCGEENHQEEGQKEMWGGKYDQSNLFACMKIE
jgi:hypothetical protein